MTVYVSPKASARARQQVENFVLWNNTREAMLDIWAARLSYGGRAIDPLDQLWALLSEGLSPAEVLRPNDEGDEQCRERHGHSDDEADPDHSLPPQ